MHEVLVNRLGGLSLPRNSVVRLTDRPDMTLDVYRGRKTTVQQQQLKIAKPIESAYMRKAWRIWQKFCMEHEWDLDVQEYQKEQSVVELFTVTNLRRPWRQSILTTWKPQQRTKHSQLS